MHKIEKDSESMMKICFCFLDPIFQFLFCLSFSIEFFLVQLFVLLCLFVLFFKLPHKFWVFLFQLKILFCDWLKVKVFGVQSMPFKVLLVFVWSAERVDLDVSFTFGIQWNVCADVTEVCWKIIVIVSVGKLLKSEFLVFGHLLVCLFCHVFKIIIILN